MESCRSSLSRRGLKRKKRRRPEQQLPATTTLRTEPEKGGSVNKSVISSPSSTHTLDLRPCPCCPVHIKVWPWPLYSTWMSSPQCQESEGMRENLWNYGECSKPRPESTLGKKKRSNGKWRLGAAWWLNLNVYRSMWRQTQGDLKTFWTIEESWNSKDGEKPHPCSIINKALIRVGSKRQKNIISCVFHKGKRVCVLADTPIFGS